MYISVSSVSFCSIPGYLFGGDPSRTIAPWPSLKISKANQSTLSSSFVFSDAFLHVRIADGLFGPVKT